MMTKNYVIYIFYRIVSTKMSKLSNVLISLMIFCCFSSVFYSYLNSEGVRTEIIVLLVGSILLSIWIRHTKNLHKSQGPLKKTIHNLEQISSSKQDSSGTFQRQDHNDTFFLIQLEKRLLQEEEEKLSIKHSKLDASFLDQSQSQKNINRSFYHQKGESDPSEIRNEHSVLALLKNKNQNSSLIRSFAEQNSSESNEKLSHSELNSTLVKKMHQITKSYVKTLSQINETSTKVFSQYKKIQRVLKNICLQVYTKNIQNILQIRSFLQEIFEIHIFCPQVKELEKKQVACMSVSLTECFQIIFEKDSIKLPWKRKVQKLTKPKSTLFSSKYSELSKKQRQNLQKLLRERFKLDQQLDRNLNKITNEKRILLLKQLKSYIEITEEYEEYRFEDPLHITQKSSSQKIIALRVFQAHISSIILRKQLQLCDQKKSWLSIFKQAKFRHFVIVQTMGIDYGHPHFDLKFYSRNKQEMYYCQFGPKNHLCLIFMYLWNLKHKFPETISQSSQLQKILSNTIGNQQQFL